MKNVTLVLCMFAFLVGYAQGQEDFLARQHISSLAILPSMGESVPNSARQLASDLFVVKFKLRNSAVQVTRPEELLTRLEQQGLMGEFANFVNLFSQTGMVNRGALKRIGEMAQADGVLLIHVLNYEESKGSWWYGKGGKNLCRIQYNLFHATSGEKIWESLEFRQHDSKLSTRPYPMERVIGDVSEKAVSSIMTGRQNVDVRRKQAR